MPLQSERVVFYGWWAPLWINRPRGPCLERPGNLTGPKSYFEMKVSRKVGSVLTSIEVHFVSLDNYFTVLFSRLLKLPSGMEKKTSLAGLVVTGSFEKGAQGPVSRKPQKHFGPVAINGKISSYRLQCCFTINIHIFRLIWTEVPFVQEISCIYAYSFLYTDELKMALSAC